LFAFDQGQVLDAEVRGSGTVGNPVVNYTYNPQGHISSKMVLEQFRDALKESYPNSVIRNNQQAVNVHLDTYGLGLDIVPCFHIIPRTGGRDFYYIPQGGESHGWMKTNPKIDGEICDAINARHGDKFKPVVKLLKHWNEVHNSSRLQSYHLETVAAYIFDNHPDQIKDYPTAIHYFFTNAAPYFQNVCQDMTTIGGPVDSYLTPENRRLTLVKIGEAKGILDSHNRLGGLIPSNNLLSGWRKIYGLTFGS
jgi:hypothetical protein